MSLDALQYFAIFPRYAFLIAFDSKLRRGKSEDCGRAAAGQEVPSVFLSLVISLPAFVPVDLDLSRSVLALPNVNTFAGVENETKTTNKQERNS